MTVLLAAISAAACIIATGNAWHWWTDEREVAWGWIALAAVCAGVIVAIVLRP